MMSIIKKIYCAFVAILFTLFAALQYNDPDPYTWIPVYMLIAILAIVSLYKKIPTPVIAIIIFFYISVAFYLWPETYMGVTMPMSYHPEIELARESLGLGIAALAMFGIWMFSFFESRKSKTSEALK